jgi:endonuclease/exonuclease/phosphatase family metal-dependent hydrolase
VRRTSVAALALGLMLLFEVLRAWLPAVIFVYGRAGSTPATQMGLFAVLPFLLAFLAAVAVRTSGPARVARSAAALAIVFRLALQLTDGGQAQLWLSTAAVTALLWWLVAKAGASAGPVAAAGVVTGLAADAVVHTVLRSVDLVWRDGALAWLGTIVLLGAFAVAERNDVTAPRQKRTAPAGTVRGPALGWLAVGGALVVHGIVAGPVSRVHTITGWPEWVAAAITVGGQLLAVVVALMVAGIAPRSGRRETSRATVALVAGLGVPTALGLALLGGPGLSALGHLLLPAVLAAAVATALRSGHSTAARRSLACAGGLLLFIAIAFGYYAAYDIALPFPNDAMVVIAALLTVTVALVVRRGTPASDARVAAPHVTAPHDPAPHGATPHVAAGPSTRSAAGGLPVLTGVLVGVLLLSSGWVAIAADPAPAQPGTGYPLRMFNYNLQMGFDIDGAHAVDRQAELLAAQEPDVVALQEVSRGWLLNASTDVLPGIAERLEMPYVFAPAADRVWGNAILSRYPVIASGSELLPRLGSAMQRSVLWVVIEVDGTEQAIVATHLQHVVGQTDVRRAQAEVVARVVSDHVEAGRPVILLGDMNAEPGADELRAFDALLMETTGQDGPVSTWPSWDPATHIDHIYVTRGLVASDVVVPASTASDHLGVGATIDLRQP